MRVSNKSNKEVPEYITAYETLEELVKECKIDLKEGVVDGKE